mmetsp:Transcript_1705/g.2302  ORF Transcript_1705/g.2302 Transcript_1705/m.2302 type:complete len:344 (-) Transcript_1705:91-1122(-)
MHVTESMNAATTTTTTTNDDTYSKTAIPYYAFVSSADRAREPPTIPEHPLPSDSSIVLPSPESSPEDIVRKRPDELPVTTSTVGISQSSKRARKIFISLLSALSGLVEGSSFQKFGFFPNIMTGNTVRCLSALAEGNIPQASFYAALVISYTVGASLFKFVLEFCSPGTKSPTNNNNHSKSPTNMVSRFLRHPLRASAWIALPFFVAADIFSGVFKNAMMVPLALGYGLVNAAALHYAGGVVTNLITGHWTKWGLGFTERLLFLQNPECCADGQGNKQDDAWSKSSHVLVPFCLSTLFSSWLYQTLNQLPEGSWFYQIPMPMGSLCGLAYFLMFVWYSRQEEY